MDATTDHENTMAEADRYNLEPAGFTGMLEFDMTIEVLGNTVKRRARAEYEYTPMWEYFDPHRRAPRKSPDGWCIQLALLTGPAEDQDEDDDDDEKSRWIDLKLLERGALSRGIWDAIAGAIDAKCRREDAERRRSATH